MNQQLYTYTTGSYFSPAGRVFGWLATLLAILMLLDGSVVAWALLPVGILTHFTRNQIAFDRQQMTYREQINLFGLVLGKKLALPGFEFLFLKKNNYSQTLESRGSMSVFRKEKYDGYIKLTDGRKLRLLQTDAKEKAMQQMLQISQDLNVELRDLTDMKYY